MTLLGCRLLSVLIAGFFVIVSGLMRLARPSLLHRLHHVLGARRSIAGASAAPAAAEAATTLVIVESIAKAKTIQKFLKGVGDDYVVDSCVGHVRDISSNADNDSVIHAGLQLKVSNMGILVHDDFRPIYNILSNRREVVDRLKSACQNAKRVILATDDDREGEAIAWHLVQVLKPAVPYERIVFHEITESAIREAFRHGRPIDMALVEAQEARIVLDKLAGYTLSPLLWRYVASGISAGRVQSCALQLIVDREKSRWNFVPSRFSSVTAQARWKDSVLSARLHAVDGRKVATARDFDDHTGHLRTEAVLVDENISQRIVAQMSSPSAAFVVKSKERRESSQSAPPPFITSTLQQEGNRKLGWSPSRTMKIAQELYEQGFITYYRTDNPVLSTLAVGVARQLIEQLYGAAYLRDHDREANTRVLPKNAQEAHEAIRPTEIGGGFLSPSEVRARAELSDEACKLYDLIYSRTLATEMAAARTVTSSCVLSAQSDDAQLDLEWRCKQSHLVFAGHLRSSAAEKAASGDVRSGLDDMAVGEVLHLEPWARSEGQDAHSAWAKPSLSGDKEEEDEGEAEKEGDADAESSSPRQQFFPAGLAVTLHTSQPPRRFTEAGFVAAMEAAGVGRPSTYAITLQTLLARSYILRDRKTLLPTPRGLIVSEFLKQHFADFIAASFTAHMEALLDGIARKEVDRVSFLRDFYFGSPHTGQAGLLPTVAQLVDGDRADFSQARSLQMPEWRDLGTVRLARHGLLFEASESVADSIREDRAMEGLSSSSPLSDQTNNPSITPDWAGDREWKLPVVMETDLRALTREKIESILRRRPPLQGWALPRHPHTQEDMVLFSGRYGLYLQLTQQPVEPAASATDGEPGKRRRKAPAPVVRTVSVPEWVSQQTPLEDLAVLASLPKQLGEWENLQVSLECMGGELLVVARGSEQTLHSVFPPQPVPLASFSLEDAVQCLTSSATTATPHSSIAGAREMGKWGDSIVYIAHGRWGPYLRAGQWLCALGKRDVSTLTLDDAIELLTRKMNRATGTAGKAAKKESAKKQSEATVEEAAASSDEASLDGEAPARRRGRPKKASAAVEQPE